MVNSKLHLQLCEFIFHLERLENLLANCGEDFWCDNIFRAKKLAEQSDGHCIVMVEGFFGGAGSLNDVKLDAPKSTNDELHEELRRVYRIAISLKP